MLVSNEDLWLLLPQQELIGIGRDPVSSELTASPLLIVGRIAFSHYLIKTEYFCVVNGFIVPSREVAWD